MAAPETEVEESKHVSEERVLATLFVCMCVNTLTLTHTHTLTAGDRIAYVKRLVSWPIFYAFMHFPPRCSSPTAPFFPSPHFLLKLPVKKSAETTPTTDHAPSASCCPRANAIL